MVTILQIKSRLKAHKGFIFISILFATIYALISLVNHACFRTYALDLGLYTKALYDYSHFEWNNSTLFKAQAENLLADHFDIFLMLASPLQYLFGTYTLLIIQIFAVLFGALGVYRYALQQQLSVRISLWLLAGFFCFYGIFSALAYDFHSNVIAAMLLPWLFLYFHKQEWKKCWLVFILMLLAKENISLWLVFIGIGLMLLHRKQTLALKMASLITLFALLYFILVIKVIMPALSLNQQYAHNDYHLLGNTLPEVFLNMFSSPLKTLKSLFFNHSGYVNNNYFKTETHLFILLSGGWLLLFQPRFFIMLIPVFFQKLLHDNPVMWTVSRQYNIEFAPVITIACCHFLKDLKSDQTQLIISRIHVMLCLAITIRLCDKTICYVDHNSIRIYQAEHYQSHYAIPEMKKIFQIIPEKAAVSAQSMFVPHLCLRPKIYQFPLVNDAEYILLSLRKNFYPLQQQTYTDSLKSLLKSSEWEKIYAQDDVWLLHRKSF